MLTIDFRTDNLIRTYLGKQICQLYTVAEIVEVSDSHNIKAKLVCARCGNEVIRWINGLITAHKKGKCLKHCKKCRGNVRNSLNYQRWFKIKDNTDDFRQFNTFEIFLAEQVAKHGLNRKYQIRRINKELPYNTANIYFIDIKTGRKIKPDGTVV